MNKSVETIQAPEFIDLSPLDINPLMQKCSIKVMYIGNNDNKSNIEKDVALKMAKTLRGCPIVGEYIQDEQDFGDHGDRIVIKNNKIEFECLTKPYGFVSPDAKVWFKTFEENDRKTNQLVVREYLMTEGYIWTEQYQEAKSIFTSEGKSQSMELDEKTLKGFWSTEKNTGIEFFIINDAVFSKLCILGDNVEPCYEGANITAAKSFSLEDGFANSLYNMMTELKFTLSKGEKEEMEKDKENNISTTFEADGGTSEGTAPEPAENSADASDTTPAEGASAEGNTSDTSAVDPMEDYAPEGETVEEALSKDASTNVPLKILQNAKSEDDDKSDKSEDGENDNNVEEEEKDKKANSKCSLEDIEKEFNELKNQFSLLTQECNELRSFKEKVENEEKDKLIQSFYMLSDEDKAEVIKNKAQYSLKEIKAELATICYDKKVSFSVDNSASENNKPAVTFNLNAANTQADAIPKWLKAVDDVKKTMNN